MAAFIIILLFHFKSRKKACLLFVQFKPRFSRGNIYLKRIKISKSLVHPYVYIYVVWQQIVTKKKFKEKKKEAIRSDFKILNVNVFYISNFSF